jgi:isoquinoline 1-oxidoreductase alpha subunit
MPYKLNVNGKTRVVDVDGDTPLLWTIRDVIGLTGTKFGCGMALCGACTVHINGNPTRSCSTQVDAVGNAKITTIEGIGQTSIGKKVQAAWIAIDVPQCGYCQSGQIMTACALLSKVPHPTSGEVDEAMAGNLCRCGTYPRIKRAVMMALDDTPSRAKGRA